MLAAVPGNAAAVRQYYNVCSDRAVTFTGAWGALARRWLGVDARVCVRVRGALLLLGRLCLRARTTRPCSFPCPPRAPLAQQAPRSLSRAPAPRPQPPPTDRPNAHPPPHTHTPHPPTHTRRHRQGDRQGARQGAQGRALQPRGGRHRQGRQGRGLPLPVRAALCCAARAVHAVCAALIPPPCRRCLAQRRSFSRVHPNTPPPPAHTARCTSLRRRRRPSASSAGAPSTTL